MSQKTGEMLRDHVPEPPRGMSRLKWYGPALLWMLSSVGSGSVLFTPRVGSQYGYELLWVALVVIVFQWVMIREAGRYTVATGRTLLDGFNRLPGPRGWAVWLIFVPQFVAAVVTIAGIAALAGSAMMIAFPGGQTIYATGLILASIVLVISGQYKGIEKVCSILGGLLIATAVISAVIVFPSPGTLAQGVVPGVPEEFDVYFVLPWVGFILAGAAGIMWFSYWVAERGYGGAVTSEAEGQNGERLSLEDRKARIAAWDRLMARAAGLGVACGATIIVSFLILGAEVLGPEDIVPEGIQVAEDLARLLGDVWGAVGRWILLGGIMIALAGTVLADQDGWGRTFADATMLLWPAERRPANGGWVAGILGDRERLKNAYALIATAILPLILFFIVQRPVDILSVAGIVAAAHTPVIVFLTLYLNRRTLPADLRPSRTVFVLAICAGLFFAAFAVVYFADLLGFQLIGSDSGGDSTNGAVGSGDTQNGGETDETTSTSGRSDENDR
ncbi:manganese transport protein MntH [Jannaschia seosinensis]|uniref:Manganese transport protein MntH n=1 Tax=Jannaschia seosinensis TaxID=313367 RepID=A0A0M7B776_9RHOB|nr:Nramp family divalent metal transporter [Jannaschia seosinensis]CUH37951.1 manganese transport protein MntH [Jannaschia seosinensis]